MTWGMVAVAGATIVGAKMGSDASKDATSAQVGSANRAADMQWRMFQENQSNQLPWLKAGRESLATLQDKIAAGPGDFKAGPGYQLRLDEGNRNLMQSAAGGAGTQSGATLKALQDYGQESASNEYDRFLNRYYQSLTPLQSMAGVGQTTAQNIGSAGQQTAGRLSNIYQQQGQAQAQGAMNQANIRTGALQGLANLGGAYFGSQAAGGGYQPNTGGGYGQPWDTSSIERLAY